VPEPIQSTGINSSVYDPAQDVCSAAPATVSSPPPAHPSGATTLVNKNPPSALPPCLPEKAALAAAAGNLVRATGGVIIGSPTVVGDIPAILVFIGSAISVGATAAALANCEDSAAAQAKAP